MTNKNIRQLEKIIDILEASAEDLRLIKPQIAENLEKLLADEYDTNVFTLVAIADSLRELIEDLQ